LWVYRKKKNVTERTYARAQPWGQVKEKGEGSRGHPRGKGEEKKRGRVSFPARKTVGGWHPGSETFIVDRGEEEKREVRGHGEGFACLKKKKKSKPTAAAGGWGKRGLRSLRTEKREGGERCRGLLTHQEKRSIKAGWENGKKRWGRGTGRLPLKGACTSTFSPGKGERGYRSPPLF